MVPTKSSDYILIYVYIYFYTLLYSLNRKDQDSFQNNFFVFYQAGLEIRLPLPSATTAGNYEWLHPHQKMGFQCIFPL